MRITKNSSAPYTCDATHDAALAMTSLYTTCTCKNGTGWVSTSDGATSCTWSAPVLSLLVTSGTASSMNVSGTTQGTTAYGSNVTFTLTNTGSATSSTISFSLSNTTNFVFNGGWDFAGNVWQWVKDTNSTNFGTNAYLSQLTSSSNTATGTVGGITGNTKTLFGSSGGYTSLGSTPYGGFGYGYLNYSAGTVLRGGSWTSGDHAGVFAVYLSYATSFSDHDFGFRCVYHP